MATYKIAPDSTGEIGMAQMRYGLHNKEDYNAANALASQTDMLNLVSNTTTYQGDLVSKTWNTSQPYGFAEMYGQTWDDAAAATISYSFSSAVGTSFSVTVRLDGPTGTVLYGGGNGSGTLNASVGDTIYVAASADNPSDPYALAADYRVPNSGTYLNLFTDNAGAGGGPTAGSGTFVITSPNTTAGLIVTAN